MDITAISRDVPGAYGAVPAIPVEKTSENRDIIRAVKALNGAEMFGSENELQFQQDPETRRVVVRLVNRKTRDVVSQVPSEYVLRVAAELKPRAWNPSAGG